MTYGTECEISKSCRNKRKMNREGNKWQKEKQWEVYVEEKNIVFNV